ncbi:MULTISPECIES: YwmB family TATA-box binding protein [Metabacillus]|uniref:YwmB family TATA-box binding protein n=1 Tax=Metabacillus TaxID=2675233 RepID=UPI001589DEBD|nr:MULTISPECIES: YwmB family TATA-box binding protein [Metabacillus]MCM3443366.1 YwmB family TATA-box binding protein [Metabacillus halosaccharovorans]
MFKKIMTILVCLFIIIFFSTNHVEGSNELELEKMMDIAHKNNIIITSWQGYIKTNLGQARDIEEVYRIVESTKLRFPFVKEWTGFDQKSHHFTVEGYINNTSSQLFNKIQIYAYKNDDKYHLFLTLEVIGEKGDEKLYDSILKEIESYIEVDKEYYTVKGFVTNKLDMEYMAKQFLNDFQADYIEGLKEEEFLSVSAYNPKWKSSIPSKNNKNINLQFGLRYNPNVNETNITIGTPIIVNEY